MRKRLPNRGVKNYRVERYYCVNLAKEKIMANGWTGNILRVNLTTGNITLEDSSKFKSFVGGMGFGYKIMYDEVPPGTKPFDEANKLVFATGPLTGSGARSEEHTSELQSRFDLVCRLLLEKKKKHTS